MTEAAAIEPLHYMQRIAAATWGVCAAVTQQGGCVHAHPCSFAFCYIGMSTLRAQSKHMSLLPGSSFILVAAISALTAVPGMTRKRSFAHHSQAGRACMCLHARAIFDACVRALPARAAADGLVSWVGVLGRAQ